MAAVITGKALTAIAGLLTLVVLTRHLGPTQFGYYRTVLTYCAFAAVLADCGIYMVTLREMSRPGGDPARAVGNALPLRLLSTASVLIAASAVAWAAIPYDRTVKWGILIGAAIYTCLQASDFLVAVFQSVLKQGRNAVAEVAGALATLAAVLLLSALHVSVLPMLGATLLGSSLALALSWRLARRLVPFHLGFDWSLWRSYLVAGLPLAGSQILGMAMLRGDSLLLSLYQPAADVGLYGVPSKLFELATSVPFLFAGLMMPAMTAAASHESRAEFSRLIRFAVSAAAIYGVVAASVLAIFAPQILDLVAGPQFAAGGTPALRVIAFAVVLAALTHVLRFSLVAAGRPRAVLAADATACVLAFAAYFALIPRFSLLGAAGGTLIAELVALMAMLWGLKSSGPSLPRRDGHQKSA